MDEIVPKFTFATLVADKLNSVVKIVDQGIVLTSWQSRRLACTEQEQQRLNIIQSYLNDRHITLMNEATIWARAIYPLLLLAERDNIQVWSQVSLTAQYPRFNLEGIVDGVVGDCTSGTITTPYLVVVEAKRALESNNPPYQLYGEMLAAAWLNWRREPNVQPQTMFGCYTISDTWTFVSGNINGFEADYPVMTIESSPEYIQRFEAETIFQIVKFIVTDYCNKKAPSKLMTSKAE